MNHNGFTLIELVMIIVIIGILAVVAAPKLTDVTTTNANVFADKLRADMRYAQNTAMTQNLRSRVCFNGTNSPNPGYAVLSTASTTCSSFNTIQNPAGGLLSVTLNTGSYAGITVTSPNECLEFDSLGRPYTSDGSSACSAAASGMIVTIKANSVAAASVTVTNQTGAVN